MSLFDVIKYPISLPPTVDQIKALPSTIVLYWMKHADNKGWRDVNVDYSSKSDRELIAKWFIKNWNNAHHNDPRLNDALKKEIINDITLLIRIIEEWEE